MLFCSDEKNRLTVYFIGTLLFALIFNLSLLSSSISAISFFGLYRILI